jgi:hypothetical protein
MDWLLENGYIEHPSEMIEMLESRPTGQLTARQAGAAIRIRARSKTRARTLRLPAKKKRKVSAYQKEFGRQLKKLKRAHPRTPVTRLMKRAHAATKRARRGK